MTTPRERVVLAYSGSLASAAAIAWLREERRADVVTVTVDVGQADDLEEVRGRALAGGAVRAHVVDAREAFARDHILPALRVPAPQPAVPLARLALPAVALTLAEVAAIEACRTVAHAGSDVTSAAIPSAAAVLAEQLAVIAPSLTVAAVAREMWQRGVSIEDYAGARHLPPGANRRHPHLLVRAAVDPARVRTVEANVEIAFAGGVPVAVNGVAMTPLELIESLSLIAGQHGIAHGDAIPAPAALLLRAAFAAAGGADGVVRLALGTGTLSAAPVTSGAAPANEGTVLSR